MDSLGIRELRGTGERLYLIVLLLFASGTAIADTVLVRASQTTLPYQTVITGIRDAIGDTARVVVVDESKRGEDFELPGDTIAAVALGAVANQREIEQHTQLPLFSLLLTRHAYSELLEGMADADRTRKTTAIYIEQPVRTQIEVARRIFPQLERFGLLYSGQSSAEMSSQTDLPVVVRRFDFEGNLLVSLRSLLSNVDGLIAIPDPDVFNQNTIHSILLTSYRLDKPVIGYSRPYVSAGALISAFSTPASIGREAGAMIRQWLVDRNMPAPRYSSRFSVAINRRVASVLGLRSDIPVDPDIEYLSPDEIR